jgi:hypothetical protein
MNIQILANIFHTLYIMIMKNILYFYYKKYCVSDDIDKINRGKIEKKCK